MLKSVNRNIYISIKYGQKYCTTSSKKQTIDITNVDEKPLFDDPKYTEEEIQQIRNKSRLNVQHRNILFNQIPYKTEMSRHHYTIKYKKHMLGRYGLNSLDVNPGICWPSEQQIAEVEEYEKVAFPWKLEDAWKMLAEKRQKEMEAIKARDLEIDRNMKKLDKWKKEMEDKIAKKEAEILKAKQRKEKLIEEVREHFGFKIDTKDERFKQLMEQKEKEEKKAKKLAKKEEKMKKYLDKLSSVDEVKDKEDVQNNSSEVNKDIK